MTCTFATGNQWMVPSTSLFGTCSLFLAARSLLKVYIIYMPLSINWRRLPFPDSVKVSLFVPPVLKETLIKVASDNWHTLSSIRLVKLSKQDCHWPPLPGRSFYMVLLNGPYPFQSRPMMFGEPLTALAECVLESGSTSLLLYPLLSSAHHNALGNRLISLLN